MPVAPVDNRGTHLYYEDSGSPQSSQTYTTIVAIHGTIYHGGMFRPIFPFAAENNLRFVTVNLRDYPGSTPSSPAELSALLGDPEGQAGWLRDRGIEIAAFLEWFIRSEHIPQTTTVVGGSESFVGGLSLLDWSSGNCVTMSVLAHVDAISAEHRRLLGQYLRSTIILDPSPHPFGLDFSEIADFVPGRPPIIVRPTQEWVEWFLLWISSYYHHTPATLSSFEALSGPDFMSGCAQAPITDPRPEERPTLLCMSEEERRDALDYIHAPRSCVPMALIDKSVFLENMRRALWDCSVWPHLRVTLVWCEMSPGEMLVGSWHLAKQIREAWPDGARKVSVKRMENANHFPHWDQPAHVVQFLSAII